MYFFVCIRARKLGAIRRRHTKNKLNYHFTPHRTGGVHPRVTIEVARGQAQRQNLTDAVILQFNLVVPFA